MHIATEVSGLKQLFNWAHRCWSEIQDGLGDSSVTHMASAGAAGLEELLQKWLLPSHVLSLGVPWLFSFSCIISYPPGPLSGAWLHTAWWPLSGCTCNMTAQDAKEDCYSDLPSEVLPSHFHIHLVW